MVPWPLMTCGWLYGGMSTAPVAACRSGLSPAAPLCQLFMVICDYADLRMPSIASQEVATSRLTWTSATFASRASIDGSHFTTCAASQKHLH
jgi:hypothetical protein